MAEKIQAIRGMHDILPDQTYLWQHVESVIRKVLASYGYQEIRMPIVEKTELFKRSIGEVTDIVEKEMYTFDDRNGDSLTLRPEGTAGCLRAGLEHGLLYNQTQRLWYMGPMFRHERPQKGRYRQFHQLGVETYGMEGPDIDVELILLCGRLWRELGISEKLQLEINTLGITEERLAYRGLLVEYFKQHFDLLDEDSRRRLETNPLRILDSKNPALRPIIEQAPVLSEHLGEESRTHFETLCSLLSEAGIAFTLNTRLVRGLDYYARTVFEWTTTELGAQGTVCAGGRYDGLVAQLGGRDSSAIGFALGVERLIGLLDNPEQHLQHSRIHAYLITGGSTAERQGLLIAEKLRNALPALRITCNTGGGGIKNQFKRADKSSAEVALIIGDDELQTETVSVKNLRTEAAQKKLPWPELIEFLNTIIK